MQMNRSASNISLCALHKGTCFVEIVFAQKFWFRRTQLSETFPELIYANEKRALSRSMSNHGCSNHI